MSTMYYYQRMFLVLPWTTLQYTSLRLQLERATICHPAGLIDKGLMRSSNEQFGFGFDQYSEYSNKTDKMLRHIHSMLIHVLCERDNRQVHDASRGRLAFTQETDHIKHLGGKDEKSRHSV
jgi:hypothetical protein